MLHPWMGLGKEPASCLWFAEIPSFWHRDGRPKDTYAPLAAGHFISLWDTLIHQDVSPLRMDVSSGLGGGGNEHGGQKAVFAVSVPSASTVQIRRPRLFQSRSAVSSSLRPRGLLPVRLLCPWDCPGKSSGVGCHCLLQKACIYI